MNEVSFSTRVWSSDGSSQESSDAPLATLQDAADFQQWVRSRPPAPDAGGPSPSTSSSPSIGKLMGSFVLDDHENVRKLESTLDKLSRTGDPKSGVELAERLSDTYLHHGLAVKVIAKTTTAMDTLMRLQ